MKNTSVDDYTGYRVFTKEDYKRYMLSRVGAQSITKSYIKHINDEWKILSQGLNFIIGVGYKNLMFYSAKCFNNHILE